MSQHAKLAKILLSRDSRRQTTVIIPKEMVKSKVNNATGELEAKILGLRDEKILRLRDEKKRWRGPSESRVSISRVAQQTAAAVVRDRRRTWSAHLMTRTTRRMKTTMAMTLIYFQRSAPEFFPLKAEFTFVFRMVERFSWSMAQGLILTPPLGASQSLWFTSGNLWMPIAM
jgi:hypothetical protein